MPVENVAITIASSATIKLCGHTRSIVIKIEKCQEILTTKGF
jgi:hypothetical protein